MANALDYLDWRGDLSLSLFPLNTVDIFLLSQLSTPDYSGIVPDGSELVPITEVADKYFSSHEDSVRSLGAWQTQGVHEALKKMIKVPRFQDTQLTLFENIVVQENSEQFCGVTMKLSDGTLVISLRGTDDNIISWKENFELATKDTLPAQRDALNYLTRVATELEGNIVLCGHSKGGNLCVYAASMVSPEIQDRITGVYNFDGPGFQPEFLEKEGYLRIKDRILTVLPEHSCVGVLMWPVSKWEIVSGEKSGPGGHNGFTWRVLGTQFVQVKAIANTNQAFGDSIRDVLTGMNPEEKQTFIDDFFHVLQSTGAVTITDLISTRPKNLMELLFHMSRDKEIRSFSREVLENSVKNFLELSHSESE